MAENEQPPKPGTPEFIAMVQHTKDAIAQEHGVQVDGMLDIGAGDDWRQELRTPTRPARPR